MKRFLKKLRGKLRGRRGESIAEVLVAMLVGCLGLMLLASMITATANLVTKSRKSMDDYYTAGNTLSAMTGASEDEIKVEPALLLDEDGDPAATIAVDEVTYEKEDSSDKIVAYRISDGG